MIAFVMSGAGARGPLQVGAMGALLEADIRPDFIVATSAGAINAVLVAASGYSHPALADIRKQWQQASASVIYPGGILGAIGRLVRRQDSLFSSDGMRKLVNNGLPPGVTTFGQLRLPLYVTAVDIISGRLFLFGEDGRAPLVEAVLASSSIPGIHPPVAYHGLQLVDGGVLANVAASVAMNKGATQIYALNASQPHDSSRPAKGVVEVLTQTLSTLLGQNLLEDLARAEADTQVDLHHILLRPSQPLASNDFSQTDSLIQAGYETVQAYLAAPRPRTVLPTEVRRTDLGEIVPGAREFVPPYWLRK